MRGTLDMGRKTYYTHTTGSKLHCDQVARRLRAQGKQVSVRKKSRNKFIVYVLYRKLKGRR